jgi:hypothetical protein
LVGATLTGAGILGAGGFAIASKVSFDAANNMESGIKTEAFQVDMKTAPLPGPCVDPANWLANQTAPREDGQPRYTGADLQARAKQYKDNCDKYSHDVKLGNRYKTLAFVSLGVAGAAAAGTLIYYFVDTSGTQRASRDTARRVVLLPIVQSGFAGGLVAGRF